jgi:hypothetical protein
MEGSCWQRRRGSTPSVGTALTIGNGLGALNSAVVQLNAADQIPNAVNITLGNDGAVESPIVYRHDHRAHDDWREHHWNRAARSRRKHHNIRDWDQRNGDQRKYRAQCQPHFHGEYNSLATDIDLAISGVISEWQRREGQLPRPARARSSSEGARYI